MQEGDTSFILKNVCFVPLSRGVSLVSSGRLMALPFLRSPFPCAAPLASYSTAVQMLLASALYCLSHPYQLSRRSSRPSCPCRAMVGLDPGLLWAASTETSFDESRPSLSLLISNFEGNVNTRPGESAASAPRQEPGQSAPPNGADDVDNTLFYPQYFSYNPALLLG